MNGAAFWFGTVPMALTIAGTLGLLFRLFTRPIPLDRNASPAPPVGTWASLPLRWGLGLLSAGAAFGVLFPGWVAGWDSSPARLYLLDGVLLAFAAWFLTGVFVRLYLFANDPGRPVTGPADWIVVGGVLFLAVASILTLAAYRWASYWGAGVLVPYLRSLFGGNPRPDLIAGLPWLVQAQVVVFFVTAAALPLSRFLNVLAVPAAAIRRTLGDLADPPRRDPAGAWLRWGPAYFRAALIVGYFVATTVFLPSKVAGWLADAPEVVRDVVTTGVWTVFLGVGIAGLWWGQRKARV